MTTKQNHSSYNAKFFKKWAPVYDYMAILIAKLRRKAAERVIGANKRILDTACGTGAQAIAFAKRGYSVTGIDLSEDMLSRAEKKVKKEYDISFSQGDATEIPHPDGYFDVSSISFGLHDMPEEIGILVLKEMMRATKSEGQIIIVDYHKPKNRIIARIVRNIVKLWESRYYDDFMQIGLDHYLDKVGLKTKHKETYFLGNAQIVECLNAK
ncbi:hypothetical protein COZ35_00090 [Candidatus Peregrinibacteria bacterium CG_4_10_14_3_um_filter_44_21]|nr:MAG: hypothetical protein COZ35_00090 [Candidatus Peregrinibacteria bacterium CG_4_10_14_3_um_filter_44_21]